MKRLHGYTPAVVDRDRGGSGTFSGEGGGYKVFLTFVRAIFLECSKGDPGSITLQTDLLTPADRGARITFNESNTADFATIAAWLTNGVNDSVTIGEEFYDKDGDFQGGSSTGATERSLFYNTLQVSTGPDYLDLAEIPLSNITFAIDSILIFFNRKHR